MTQALLVDRPHLTPLRYPARTIETNFIALCGVSCSGKTTLGNYLVEAGFPRMPETMRVWLEGLKAQGIDIGTLKTADRIAFRRDLFEVAHSIVEQQALFDPTQQMVFNRPGIDAIVFMKAEGLDYSRELERMKVGPRFKCILLFEPLPFTADGIRVVDPALRDRQHKAYPEVLSELGYCPEQVIRVPAFLEGVSLSRDSRAEFVINSLKRCGIDLSVKSTRNP